MRRQHLEFLVALARERALARAAQSAGVQAPDVELAWAPRILGRRDDVRGDLRTGHSRVTSELTLAVIPSAVPVMAILTGPVARSYPGVTMTVRSTSAEEIADSLAAGTVDAAITYVDALHAATSIVVPLYKERYELVTPRNGPFGSRARVTWREAASLPLCLPASETPHGRRIDAQFAAAAVVARPRLDTDSFETLLAHVNSGQLSTVLPATVSPLIGESCGMVSIPLIEPRASYDIGLVVERRDPLAPILAALIAAARAFEGASQQPC